MSEHDNSQFMSILFAIGGIVMSVIAAMGTVVRLLVTGRASIISDVDMMIQNKLLQQKLDCTNEYHTTLDAIKRDIAEIKQSVNGGGK